MRSCVAATFLLVISLDQASAQLARVRALDVGADGVTMSIFSSFDFVFSEDRGTQAITLFLQKEDFPTRDLNNFTSLGFSRFALDVQLGSIRLTPIDKCQVRGEKLGHGVIRVSVVGCRSEEVTSADTRDTLNAQSYLGSYAKEKISTHRVLAYGANA